MFRSRNLTKLLSASALWLAACATSGNDVGGKPSDDRDQALETLQLKAGAPVTLEVNEAGTTRVLAMTPRFPVPGHATDPAVVATDFLATHHDVFRLASADASEFAVTRVDNDPTTGLRHITLNRTYNGIPVFQGGISVHMDSGNNVYRALGDESYNIAAPTNRMMLSPAEAALAAGRALGVTLTPVLAESGDQHAVFTSAGALDPIHVDQKIVHVAQGDDRFAYQTTVSWLDDQQQQQYELALIDAQDGSLLFQSSLVNTFTGRAFTASPGAHPTTDTRVLVSFDGNPAASPSGWVGTTRKTIGNNAVAATDLNGNNTVGTNETQPTADANNSFDFPFSPTTDAASFKSAAVADAFFLVNDYHDRTYALGFTEAAGNFQTSNFGKGGAQNDAVNVDAQDGSGTNNANFSTPPDGQKPRMQMFLFSIVSGTALRQDGDFDPGVIYHENSHGLSNRLVGGGTTTCLGGIQSGGMGEGWGDFMGASFLNDPVVGAYVTGNATVGIRKASMAASPFTYANIKDGTMTEVHNAGEIWAAALWAVRSGIGNLGAATTERLVVQGMKNTPCNPTMIQARDGIITADQQLNGGANRCALFAAFASRQMGFGASSPNANSTSTIVLSSAVPSDCGGGGGGGGGTTRDFVSTDVPKSIPDNNATGVNSVINVPAGPTDTLKVTVDVNITHTFRGDLVIQVVSPTGQAVVLSNRAGGSADNFVTTAQDISASFTSTGSPVGQWRLFVQDLAAVDVGTINSFALHITSTN